MSLQPGGGGVEERVGRDEDDGGVSPPRQQHPVRVDAQPVRILDVRGTGVELGVLVGPGFAAVAVRGADEVVLPPEEHGVELEALRGVPAVGDAPVRLQDLVAGEEDQAVAGVRTTVVAVAEEMTDTPISDQARRRFRLRPA